MGLHENELSKQSKEALQSETWQKAREAIIAKREIKHFTLGDNADYAYGATWAEAVNTYLKTCYKDADGQNEIEAFGITYKVLRRDKVTVFYDAGGNTLFDVENERLASEYEWWMNALEKKEKTKQEEAVHKDDQIRKQIDESEDDLKGSAVPMKTIGETEAVTVEEVPDVNKDNIETTKDRAKNKLENELEKAKDKSFAEPIISYLLKRCAEDNGLAEDVIQEHKTYDKCFDYIYSKAKKQAKGNCAAVRDDVVYEWAEDYFHKDDKVEKAKKIVEVDKRTEMAADKKTKAETIPKEKNTPEEKKRTAPAEKKEKPKPKKNGKEMNGQMDLFSMMGV